MIIRGRYIEALATTQVKKLRPQDLTDDELREFGLMEDDLVERLRGRAQKGVTGETALLLHEAADRIEQLERELAAEKALADRAVTLLDRVTINSGVIRILSGDDVREVNGVCAAYRKARGM